MLKPKEKEYSINKKLRGKKARTKSLKVRRLFLKMAIPNGASCFSGYRFLRDNPIGNNERIMNDNPIIRLKILT